MTNKERTIKAVELLIKRYKFIIENAKWDEPGTYSDGIDKEDFVNRFKDHPDLDIRNMIDFHSGVLDYMPGYDCPLCKIFNKDHSPYYCKGCPVADQNGDIGCESLAYFDLVLAKLRLDFWKRNLEKIKRTPKERFTKKGWVFFNLG